MDGFINWVVNTPTSLKVIVGAVVTMIGWGVKSWLDRRNRKKSAEEALMEKVRVELTKLVSEYGDWLEKFRASFIPQGNGLPAKGYLDEAWINKVSTTCQELDKISNRSPFFRRFEEHKGILPNLYQAVAKLQVIHINIMKITEVVIKDFDRMKKTHKYLDWHIEMDKRVYLLNDALILQITLANQIAQAIHFECTKTLDVTKLSEFKDAKFAYLQRDSNGQYFIFAVGKDKEDYEKAMTESSEKRAVELRRLMEERARKDFTNFYNYIKSLKLKNTAAEKEALKKQLEEFAKESKAAADKLDKEIAERKGAIQVQRLIGNQ